MSVRIDKAKFAYELAKHNMTQKSLAEKAGISRMTMYCASSGKGCSDQTANKITAALDVPLEKLLKDREE